MPKPTVSVVCVTYNHAKFIKQALDGFISQKTDFAFEVLIHDDCSTDGSIDIIKDYQQKYPAIIKPVFEEKNQYSTGDYSFINDLYIAAQGKYIAFCEADDYWTHDTKLQQQVDFMEKHPDHTLCFHPVRVFFENGEGPDSTYPTGKNPADFTLDKLIEENFIQSNSVMYRRQEYQGLPSDIIPSDWYMHLYHAQFGKIGFIDKVMSAYRRQPGGVWYDAHSNIGNIWVRFGAAHLAMHVEVLRLFDGAPAYRKVIEAHIADALGKVIRATAEHGGTALQTVLGRFPVEMQTALLDQYATQHQELDSLKIHMDKQAEIMRHQESEIASLTLQLQTAQHHLRRINATMLGKAARASLAAKRRIKRTK